MKTQLLRIYERYAANDRIRILSHSIDPAFDTPSVLKQYAERLQVKAPRWNMLTGDKTAIYKLGEKSYMVTAQEDKNEAGGFVHSGAFILVDKNRHVRGIYDGTQEAEVNHLIEDIEILLQENNEVDSIYQPGCIVCILPKQRGNYVPTIRCGRKVNL